MSSGTGNPSIPLFDLRIEDDDLAAVAETIRSGRLALGERTERFEQAFAAHLGARHAIALSSCTAALHLAYLAAGVGPGDEVIVPSYTMAATASAVLQCGATPVFAEIVGRERPSLDPDDVARRITERTKAVAVVHFAGYAAAADRLAALCDERGLALIEDAAHAPDASLGGRALGTFGLAGAFSFFSNKVLSAGEGGLLCTDDDDVAAFARSRRSLGVVRGADGSRDVEGVGFNYRMDEPHAALLLSRMRRLRADVERRRELTLRYRELLAGLDGVLVPYDDADVATCSAYVMPVMLEEDRQVEVSRRLREQGIQTSILYAAVHGFTAYRERFPDVSLPRTEHAARTELTLPLFPTMTEAEQDRVVGALAEAVAA
ncbi:DegT/DnrJ/EryC1/StrS family aminotransferase [Conexibacter arvalis]|uniref:dTDP-4-amino-4,6-dideoxygalactose transaminase n=1 Tax=Conexibacter arvalis TaxID=912552 RepID=A0A840I9R2_9ACTN|nr:DegT/DnrJ/EryC1/StrS family aminotransferase [Conexibacter arvalis]MBB4661649.1 dTDP-4-amino-4,6-dideoxygalactose transaminase [Conexibacter arvalis]